MIAFGVVTCVVTGALALLTWDLSSTYLLEQRQASALRQATVNARLVEIALRSDPGGLTPLLTGIGAEAESAVLLISEERWITSSNVVDPVNVPAALVTLVENGTPARQRIRLDGVPVLVVGLPIPSVHAAYVEVFPLRELDRTLRFISTMLIIGAAGSGLAGALIGRWAAGRALRPLADLTSAAADVAAGDLSARLPATSAPDLARLAGTFNATAERLQQRVARDARFAGDVSHELRTPLTTMVNAISVLRRRRDEMSDDSRQAVDLLDADLRRFQRMVRDLLEISTLDQGDGQLQLEPVDLADLVRHAVESLSRDQPLRLDIAASPRVLVDRRRMERVLANLVDNAERHGGGVVRIGVLVRDDLARIEIDDRGPGIPAADRDRVFERFARTGSHGHDEGVGLGLALAAQHVQHHNGQIKIQDRPGGGARFIVEIPLATD